jgi:hypothetical protein
MDMHHTHALGQIGTSPTGLPVYGRIAPAGPAS